MSPSKTDITVSGKAQDKVLSPCSLAHVVLRTARLPELLEFWSTFLGATVTHKDDSIAFLRYDEEHHRIALIAVPETRPRDGNSAGLHHIAFSYKTIADLLLAYKQRKALGVLPKWSVNHGPTTSIYYEDPDGNLAETQVDNFDTPEAAIDFMTGPLFAENPIGTDFDPEALLRSVESGIPESELKKRVEIGSRTLKSEI